MFITADFVYIHVPKTGGTFVAKALRTLCETTNRPYIDTTTPEGRALLKARDQHGTVRDLPQPHSSKPVLCGIRHPLDYYVSLFEFGWWKTHHDGEFDVQRVRQRFPSYPQLSFSAFVEATNDWRLWPEGDRAYGRLTENHVLGLFTWKLITMLSSSPEEVFSDFEAFADHPFTPPLFPELHSLRLTHLAEDLVAFLTQRGVPAHETAFINDLGVIYPAEGGRSPGSDLSRYCDGSVVAFVRSVERFIFARWPEFTVDGLLCDFPA